MAADKWSNGWKRFNGKYTIMNNLDICVLTHGTRHNISSEFLTAQGIDHKVIINPDHEFTEEIHQSLDPLHAITNENVVGAYRGFRGHQLCLEQCSKEYSLIFEYDARPLRDDWLTIVEDCIDLTDQYGILNLHARLTEPASGFLYKNKYAVATSIKTAPIVGGVLVRRVCGALAYVVNSKMRDKLIADQFTGFAIDIHLFHNYPHLWLWKPDLFLHDESQGSLTHRPIQ